MIYPFHCESQKDLLAFTAHSDTVFPDMEPFDVVYDGDIMRCPGVGDNTSNLAIMMLLAAWFTKNNYVPNCGILDVYKRQTWDLAGQKLIIHGLTPLCGKAGKISQLHISQHLDPLVIEMIVKACQLQGLSLIHI